MPGPKKPKGGRVTPKNPKLKMAVIPEPAEGTRAVLVPGEGVIALTGSGKTDWVCGQCGTTLLAKIGPQQAQDIVVLCPSCGAYNDLPV